MKLASEVRKTIFSTPIVSRFVMDSTNNLQKLFTVAARRKKASKITQPLKSKVVIA